MIPTESTDAHCEPPVVSTYHATASCAFKLNWNVQRYTSWLKQQMSTYSVSEETSSRIVLCRYVNYDAETATADFQEALQIIVNVHFEVRPD